MPSNQETIPIADLSRLLQKLSEAGIEFILVGGIAAVVQGAPVSTFDLDIVHRQNDENINKLLQFLKSVDAIQRRPDDKILQPRKKDLKAKGHILLTTCHGPLDILAFIEKGFDFEDLLSRTVDVEFRGHKLRVLSLETIIQLKRESEDPKDQYRLPILEETLRQILENE